MDTLVICYVFSQPSKNRRDSSGHSTKCASPQFTGMQGGNVNGLHTWGWTLRLLGDNLRLRNENVERREREVDRMNGKSRNRKP